MMRRLINTVTWLLVAGSVAIILGGLLGRPILLASVPTTSMVPVLTPGDMILVVPYVGTTLHDGQIVVFRTEKDPTWIVHRVIGGNEEEGFVTQGDANRVPDPNRVFPRHVAGIVPQLGRAAIRVPRMGLLSLERNPLSNPLVAGIALILGMYLMASDARAGMQLFRTGFRRTKRLPAPGPKPKVVLAIYGGLALAVFLISLFTMWSLSSTRNGQYRVVASQAENVLFNDVMVAGQERTETLTLKNPSPIPLIIGMEATDAALSYTPGWFLLMPKSQREVTLRIYSIQTGTHSVTMRQSVFLPLLPARFLQSLSYFDWHLPAIVTALVPALIVVAIAASDNRVWLQLHLIRLHLEYRLWG